MSLIERIKSVLGLNGSAPRDEEGPVAVTVEHEPAAGADDVEETSPETESAEPDPGGLTHDGPVTEIPGIGPSYSDRLAAAGVTTVGELARADADELGEATDLSPSRISGWIESAEELASGN